MESTVEIGGVRRKLGTLTGLAIRALTLAARRLGVPAIATMTAVPVSAAMLTRLDTVTAGQSLEDAASIMVTGRQPYLPVVKNGEPAFVVTKDDVAAGLRRKGPHASVTEAPHHDVVTVTPSESLSEVLEKLRAAPESVALVVDNGEAVGLLTFDRVVEYLERNKRVA